MPEKDAGKNAVRPRTLYLVATPIGNLEDMTFRALQVLRQVDLIAAEDTRHSLKLLTHFGIQAKKLISCFDHNEVKRVPEVLETLAGGGSAALITDAGMPAISDPGYLVVQAVAAAGFQVSPLPGASSVLAALAASGLPATPFTFLGFLPPKAGDRQKALARLKSEERTLVFFESPHRLRQSLKDMLNAFGDRKCVVARELTKLHEEVLRGRLEEMGRRFQDREVLGEFVVVVEGGERVDRSAPEKWHGASIEDQLRQFLREGLTKTEAVKAVCKLRDLPREVVYRIATGLKPEA
ncbi:MAG TPA: 16S rRNA (cytidine(1402)-2'-O)-methyltransferase [bacterium]|nr:16S rRNA (cytidine(1402)-2'-O)-methyltransferase [bacterium]